MKIIKFFLMERDNDKKSLKALNDRYVKMFCQKFGGATVYRANGYWSNGSKLFKDQTLVCEIFINVKDVYKDNKRAMYQDIKNIAKQYKQDARQKAVSVEIDGHAFIIE